MGRRGGLVLAGFELFAVVFSFAFTLFMSLVRVVDYIILKPKASVNVISYNE